MFYVKLNRLRGTERRPEQIAAGVSTIRVVSVARGTAASTFPNATEKAKREMDPVRRIMEHAS